MNAQHYQDLKQKFSNMSDNQIAQLIQSEFAQELNLSQQELASFARQTLERLSKPKVALSDRTYAMLRKSYDEGQRSPFPRYHGTFDEFVEEITKDWLFGSCGR